MSGDRSQVLGIVGEGLGVRDWDYRARSRGRPTPKPQYPRPTVRSPMSKSGFAKFLVAVAICLGVSTSVSWAQKIPSPDEFLGFRVGADFHLATYQQAYKYFKALE